MSSERDVIRVPGHDRVYDRRRILFVLLLPLAMSMMAVSAVNVVLGSIETGLGASATDLQWVLTGYALVFGVSMIPAGRSGDVLGRGSHFVLGLALFVLGSIGCAVAPDPLVLNLARLLQGLGAGIFNPQITGMIQQYFTGAGRARAYALFGLVISASVAVGPLLAGAIVQALGRDIGWRAAFLINLPLGALGLVLALVWFPFTEERRHRAADARVRVDLDPVGALLLAGAVLCLMLPFMVRTPWTWALIPLALVMLWLWTRWERRYAIAGREPMVDLALFRFPSFTWGTAVSGSLFLGTATIWVVVALYVQSAHGFSPLQTGLLGLPNAILSGVAAVWAGRHVMTHGRTVVLWSLVGQIVGILLSIGVAVGVASGVWSPWLLAVPLSLNGIGMGAFGAANQTLSLLDVPIAASGTAGGIKATVERVATAIGNAMITGVFFGVHAATTWTWGFVAGFAVIGAAFVLALGCAVHDVRRAARVAG